jgi:membrane-associated protease RseP (regulator of RpoE activity)
LGISRDPLFYLTMSVDLRIRRLPVMNLALFLLTVISTLVAGALQQGINPFQHPSGLWSGIPFSFALLLILGAHEFGHYFMSRKHRMEVTLPYFIPAPSLIGTFGAFIKIRSPIMDRRTLLDIGASGPLAGMAMSVPILLIGLTLSRIGPVSEETGISLGNSLLFTFLSRLVWGEIPSQLDLILHPVAFAGWIGLLVTCINLLPAGQLDGGHVAYAIFGSGQKHLGRIMIAVLVVLGVTGWEGWLVWAVILLFMGTTHPPVVYDWLPLDKPRKAVGWVTLAVFAATFMPAPF